MTRFFFPRTNQLVRNESSYNVAQRRQIHNASYSSELNASGKLRILHVLTSSGLGGCESLCRDLMIGFREQGITSDVLFLTSEDGPTRQKLNASGFNVYHSDWRGRRISGMRELVSLCEDTNPSAVMCYGFGVTHLLVSIAAKLGGVVRSLVYIGNPPPAERLARWKSALCGHVARAWCNGEVACSYYVMKLSTQRYRLPTKRVHVVWNCCAAEEICQRAVDSARKRIQSGSIVFGMIARMDQIKDYPTVLRAFASYANSRGGAKLRLIGDGPTKADLTDLARSLGVFDAVEFTGARSDVAEQLGLLDVFLYGTTTDEGFGTVLVEAMAAGLPVICTDVGPCREVLHGGAGGILVPPADPEAMAVAMCRLIADEPYRLKLGLNARRLAQEFYSIDVIARQYASIITDGSLV